MANETISPIRFGSTTFSTAGTAAAVPGVGPGPNDPQLGDFCEESGKRWVFVYNDGGASAAVGCAVVLNSAASGYSVTVSSVTSADYPIGVVQNATFLTGTYGWVMVRGLGSAKMMTLSGTVAARQLLELGANGLFYGQSNTTGNGGVWGQAVSAIVSTAVGAAFISCFG
jgi:hypothetical protein